MTTATATATLGSRLSYAVHTPHFSSKQNARKLGNFFYNICSLKFAGYYLFIHLPRTPKSGSRIETLICKISSLSHFVRERAVEF